MRHQVEGVDFLLRLRSGLLAFEQGLGKTLVAIEAFRRLLSRGQAQSMVVICPNSLKGTWAAELQRFGSDLEIHTVTGGAQQRRRGLSITKAAVVLVNYEAARNEIVAIRALMQRRRTVLVLDESHYVKNYRSLNCIAAQYFAPLTMYRWLLSGTPVTNTPADVYPQLCLVAGEQPLGSFAAFEAKYGDANSSPAVRATLAAKIQPYLLRRTKEDCLDLPDKIFVDVLVHLPSWQRRLYDAMRDSVVREVEGMSEDQFRSFVPTAMTRLLRLSQIASNPRLLVHTEDRLPGKFAELDRILEELVKANQRKVILWSYYVQTIETLIERYNHYGVASLYGETPVEERQQIATRFQDDSNVMVLIANPAAAGTGFTLTAATYAIYETLTWRYDYYAQSQDRNHRIGQDCAVTYIRLIADNTIEQVIAAGLERKKQFASEIIGDTAAQTLISNMTPDAFCDMLKTGTIREQESHHSGL